MKRTPMKPRQQPLQRTAVLRTASASSTKKAAPAPRARLKPKKVAPTAEESRWMAAIADLGCCVCMKFHQVHTPAAVHHIVEGSRRLGHFYTIPLCDPGHHQNSNLVEKISRHPYKARFEKKYGTEYELLEYVQDLLDWKPV